MSFFDHVIRVIIFFFSWMVHLISYYASFLSCHIRIHIHISTIILIIIIVIIIILTREKGPYRS